MADSEPIGTSESHERVFNGGDLAPMEHFLLGGSIDFKGNGVVGLSWMLNELDQNKPIDADLLIPPNVVGKAEGVIAETNGVRNGQEYKNKGLMWFLDAEAQIFLSDQGLSVGMVLGEVGRDRKIVPDWELVLIEDSTNTKVSSTDILKYLKLTEQVSKHFELAQNEDSLHFKLKNNDI